MSSCIYGSLVIAIVSQIVSLLRLNFGSNTPFPFPGGAHHAWTNFNLDLTAFAIFIVGSYVVWKSYAFFQKNFHCRWSFKIRTHPAGHHCRRCDDLNQHR